MFWALLAVNHLVASLQPADAGHLPARSCSIHVNNHVIFCHQQLQAAHNISEEKEREREKQKQMN